MASDKRRKSDEDFRYQRDPCRRDPGARCLQQRRRWQCRRARPDVNGKFMAAAKAAGLDQTLAGPGPYTVIVADDAAFTGLPAGTYDNWLKPENRAQLTKVLTNMILPGTVLAEDISKAIDNGKGKAVLATMGGGTLTATKDGDKIVLTSADGKKATVTKADEKFTNGVVHHVDAVLM